jgi:hypothetical protein
MLFYFKLLQFGMSNAQCALTASEGLPIFEDFFKSVRPEKSLLLFRLMTGECKIDPSKMRELQWAQP